MKRLTVVAAWVCLGLVGINCGCLLRPIIFPPGPIPSHRGDGVFRDISRPGIRGYSVSMPEFDLDKPHDAQYQLAGLTNIGRKCGVYLAIHDPDRQWWFADPSGVGGVARLDLVDSEAKRVLSVSGRLGDFVWWGGAGDDFHALYQLDRSFFIPDEYEEYTLRISYVPWRSLKKDTKGFVYVRCGGNK